MGDRSKEKEEMQDKFTEHEKNFNTLLLREYDYLTDLFISNEELGEKRIQLFLTLAAAVLTFFTAFSTGEVSIGGIDSDPRLFLAVSVVLFLFGLLTLKRLITRNKSTDKQKNRLDKIRKHFATKKEAKTLPFNPYKKRKTPRIKNGWKGLFSFNKGGLVENVVLMNSVIVTGFVIFLSGFLFIEINTIPKLLVFGLVVIFTFIGSWLFQMSYVRYEYKMKAAGGLVWRKLDNKKHIAVIRRSRYEGEGWTLPKGKLEIGEKWKEAAIREVCQEIGCLEKDLDIKNFAGRISYLANGIPKIVKFWNMELNTDYEVVERDDEVLEVKWVLPVKGLKDARVLSYKKEQDILNKNLP